MNQLVFMDRTLFITIKSENSRPSNKKKKCTSKNAEKGEKVMTCTSRTLNSVFYFIFSISPPRVIKNLTTILAGKHNGHLIINYSESLF